MHYAAACEGPGPLKVLLARYWMYSAKIVIIKWLQTVGKKVVVWKLHLKVPDHEILCSSLKLIWIKHCQVFPVAQSQKSGTCSTWALLECSPVSDVESNTRHSFIVLFCKPIMPFMSGLTVHLEIMKMLIHFITSEKLLWIPSKQFHNILYEYITTLISWMYVSSFKVSHYFF